VTGHHETIRGGGLIGEMTAEMRDEMTEGMEEIVPLVQSQVGSRQCKMEGMRDIIEETRDVNEIRDHPYKVFSIFSGSDMLR